MNKLIKFDVLVVYTESLAVSASADSSNATPFPIGSRNESYNTVYGFFLETCEKNGINVAFTTSADIVGAGCCSSFWIYKNRKWIKDASMCCSSLIFDKFSPTRKRIKTKRDLLFSSDEIKPFNDSDLFELFFDKQKTYEALSDYSIPTLSLLDVTFQGIESSCRQLSEKMTIHPETNDFSTDIVMKDRFGAGGRNVYKFKANQVEKMLAVAKRNKKVSYIIQPFAKFDLGFKYRDNPASTDIRLVFLGGKIVQSYIREAKSTDFRCNEHQGGSLTYIPLEEVPEKLVEKSILIAEILNKKGSLFALDFIISNNGNIYLLEGNTGPGLDWNMSLIKNEMEAKKLIDLVVKELVVKASVGLSIYDERVTSIVPISGLVYSGIA